PAEVAALRREDFAVDSSFPQGDVVIHPLLAQDIHHSLRRRHERIALAVEMSDPRLARLLQEAQMVIAPIGLEPGVDRGDDRYAARPCPPRGRTRRKVG